MDPNILTPQEANARFLAILAESRVAGTLTTTAVENGLLINGTGNHRVVFTHWLKAAPTVDPEADQQLRWLKTGTSQYTIPPLNPRADIAIMLPLRPPLVVLSEDVQPYAAVPLVPASDVALAECLAVLDRFKDKPLEDLRQIYVQWGLLSLWQLALGSQFNPNWLLPSK